MPPQMAKYAQILAGKHWRDVLGEDGLLRREASSAIASSDAAPHNAWQARPLPITRSLANGFKAGKCLVTCCSVTARLLQCGDARRCLQWTEGCQ